MDMTREGGQIARQDAPFYSYRAEVSIPLGNRTARNNYKAAKAATIAQVVRRSGPAASLGFSTKPIAKPTTAPPPAA